MSRSNLRPALVLGLLSAVGPFAIDMYLPAMPAIAADLATEPTAIQHTLTAYFLAFGVAQLVYGPWADAAGRRAPLVAGLAIFILGSIGCALAPSVGWLIAARAVQGLGGAAVMVIPRAIIRDMHTGPEATRLMALVMLVISVSPMLAPLAGSGIISFGSWRLIFGALCLAALLSVLLTTFVLPETLPASRRTPVAPGALLVGAKRLLTDPVFLGLTFVGGFGFASFMVFIASAAFVYTDAFGLSPTGFSLAFAVNAIGFFGASQLAAALGQRFGMTRMVFAALGGFAATTLGLLGVALLGAASLPVVVAFLFCANAFLGLVMPTVMVMALDEHGEIAGLASSLGGTLQMIAGGVVVALAGPFFDGTVLPMVAAIAACAVVALGLASLTLRPAPAAPAA